MKTKTLPRSVAALLCASLLAACDRPADKADPKPDPLPETNADSKLKDELKEAGEHLKEAGSIAADEAAAATRQLGDLLEAEWDQAKDGAHDTKEKFVEAYGENLEVAVRQAEKWRADLKGASQEQLDALDQKIAAAREKLGELKDASEDNWDATKAAFKVGWHELRDAFKKSKETFDTHRR